MTNIEAITLGSADRAPKQMVFLIHGYGANGRDLLSLAESWRHSLPEARFLSLEAPFACESSPEDPSARQWFSMSGGSNRETLARGLDHVEPFLTPFIQNTLSKSGPAPPYAIVGFSQGAMLAVYAGLKARPPPRAIISYSGAFIGMEGQPAAKPPVLLVHGLDDDVVPAGLLELSRSSLKTLEVPVTAVSYPNLGHGIHREAMEAGREFLATHLSPVSSPERGPK